MFENFLLRCSRSPIQAEAKMGRTTLALLAAAMLVNAFGCSNGNVRAAAPPPPPVVEVAPVVQKDVPVQGEWVGTLEGYVNAQIQPQVSGYLIRQDYQKAHSFGRVNSSLRLIRVHFRPCSTKREVN
jgi:membrane fusion protein (multidrug efflux system)